MRAVTKENLLDWFRGDSRHEGMTPEVAKSLVKIIKDHNTKIDPTMEACNAALRGHGVEAIRCGMHVSNYWQDICAVYVNMGDTYDATILYDTVKGKFYVTTMGDFVEARSEEYEIL